MENAVQMDILFSSCGRHLAEIASGVGKAADF